MSLLIDALRRAEKEKRREAQKQKSSDSATTDIIDGELSLADPEPPLKLFSDTPTERNPPTPPKETINAETSLSSAGENDQKRNALTNAKPNNSAPSGQKISAVASDTALERLLAEDASTDSMISKNTASAAGNLSISLQQMINSASEDDEISKDKEFYDTVINEKESCHSVPASLLASNIAGREAMTPVTANTFFKAAINRVQEKPPWLIVAYLALAILVCVGLVYLGYPYLSGDHSTNFLAVDRPNNPQPYSKTVQYPPPSTTGIKASNNRPSSLPIDTEKTSRTATINVELPPEIDRPVDKDVRAILQEISASETLFTEPSSSGGVSRNATTPEEIDSLAVPATTKIDTRTNTRMKKPRLQEVVNLSPVNAKITKDKDIITPPLQISSAATMDSDQENIKAAHRAYSRGDIDVAKKRYQAVLTALPDNYDALTGLGVIAQQRGNVEEGIFYFSRVLKLRPDDRLARVAMNSLLPNRDPVEAERFLKRLLIKSPEDPNLSFSIGNLYATQKRWNEARKAFFAAYALTSSNPDYAFNLAIALDYLGKPEEATKYYLIAVDGAALHRAGFDADIAKSRIKALSLQSSLSP